jgi:hypothetical protein
MDDHFEFERILLTNGLDLDHAKLRGNAEAATSFLLKCPSSDVPIPVDMAMEDGVSLT